MIEEMVDVVDKNGNPVYKVSKKEAHGKGLLHRCVISEIINSQDEWLLIIPNDHKQDSGQYVSPVGGHVSAEEEVEAALKRECWEEVRIEVVNFKKIGEGIFNRKILGRHENHYFILFEAYTNEKPKLSNEGKSYKYFTKEEIKRQINSNPKIFGEAFHFIYRYIYKEFKDKS